MIQIDTIEVKVPAHLFDFAFVARQLLIQNLEKLHTEELFITKRGARQTARLVCNDIVKRSLIRWHPVSGGIISKFPEEGAGGYVPDDPGYFTPFFC